MGLAFDNYLESSVCEKLRSVQLETLSPIESLNLLYELKKMLMK